MQCTPNREEKGMVTPITIIAYFLLQLEQQVLKRVMVKIFL